MTEPSAKAIECEYSVQGKGPPLVLVHGIGAARNTWNKLLPVLTPDFQVITYDLRGHGSSPLPDGEFGLDDLVADLENLRQRLGLEKFHLAGHSLGGMTGPAYARKYPSRVLSLGLLSTAAFRTADDSEKVWAVVKAMEANGIANTIPNLTNRWFTDDFVKTNGDVVEARLKQVVATNPEIFLNVFRIYASTEMSPWLNEIDVPSLILTGENDGGCNPRLNCKIQEAMPYSKLVILPDLKHSILLEAGEIVAQEMSKFLHSLRT